MGPWGQGFGQPRFSALGLAAISLGVRMALRLRLRVADGLSQHFAQLGLGLWRFSREGFLPVCHQQYVGMRQGELNPLRRAACTSAFARILLQKSFYTDQHKFSGPYARRSNNHLRDYVICGELTGGFGNGLEATSTGDGSSFAPFARN